MKRKLSETIQKQIRGLSPIWIVPFVAVIFATSLAIDQYFKRGILVTLTFDDAAGITANKTRIKLKDVNIGIVTSIRLDKSLEKVQVKAEIDRNLLDYLTEESQFWVVKPKVSALEVANLNTLISGVYIQMEPSIEGKQVRQFTASTRAPHILSNVKGRSFVLAAPNLAGIDRKTPIFYKHIDVGEIIDYKLSDDGQKVLIDIFVREPFSELVSTSSRFWKLSAVNVQLGAEGLKAQMGSLASIVRGGVEFDTPDSAIKDSAPDGYQYLLHKNRAGIDAYSLDNLQEFYVTLPSKPKGLSKQSPVKYKGFNVGHVSDYFLETGESETNQVMVKIALAPSRFIERSRDGQQNHDIIGELIREGLHIRVKSNPVIAAFVHLELFIPTDINTDTQIADARTPVIANQKSYKNKQIIPLETMNPASITEKISHLIDTLSAFPLEAIGNDVRLSAHHLKLTMMSLSDNDLPKEINELVNATQQTIASMNNTVRHIDGMVAPDAQVHAQLGQTLESLDHAASALDLFLDDLQQNPEILVHGVKDE